ncbi:hypothetical protein FKN04_09315 [Bacillus glycinifermentans]|uniref:hypothetical protein n=1 Tax=Bacillus glycinifermentans TaxID=1664069 RepID=UPI00158200D1|nr:hypothetical protein [Bacillus glycinifermentans]NUJ16791.1 hypothetical protein [Bacillus glycinifermentans]
MLPNQRSKEQRMHDYITAIQQIEWICNRARRHGVDMNDVTEIEEAVDMELGRDEETQKWMRKQKLIE